VIHRNFKNKNNEAFFFSFFFFAHSRPEIYILEMPEHYIDHNWEKSKIQRASTKDHYSKFWIRD